MACACGATVALMDLGFSSHAFHSSARLVFMEASVSKDRKSLTFTPPPNGKVFPPGPAFVFLTVSATKPSALGKGLTGCGSESRLTTSPALAPGSRWVAVTRRRRWSERHDRTNQSVLRSKLSAYATILCVSSLYEISHRNERLRLEVPVGFERLNHGLKLPCAPF